MILTRISLVNFRNYKKISIKFDKHMNIFIGNNAQGKTNILESIYILAITKSHRYGNENHLIKKDAEQAKIFGSLKVDKIPRDLEVVINKQKKVVKLNKTEIRRISDYITNMNVIMFCPDDISIIKDSPQVRRNLLNIEISQLYKEYITIYNEFNKILKTRNEYLKLMYVNHLSDERYLDILTDKLIEKSVIIYKYRNDFIAKVNENIGEIFKKITEVANLKVKYIPNIEFENFSDEVISKKLSEKFTKNRNKELQIGSTLYGPHRDDFSFLVGNDDIKIFGSQGQQKIALISFKLAEISIFRAVHDTSPILLLDDIFSEIDNKKKNQIIKFLKDDIQVFITTTDLKNINKSLLKEAKIIEVHAGKLIEKVGI